MRSKKSALVAVLPVALAIALCPQAALATDEADDVGTLTAGIIAESTQADQSNAQERELPDPVYMEPMYRLYNAFSGEHFYTADYAEKDELTNVGWFYEGVGWQAPSTSNTPVFRLYNPVAGDHHYTSDKAERDKLVKVGWSDEGVGWYSDDAKSIPVYRQYNPNAWTGTHNYTYDKGENDDLVQAGWEAENIAWYGSGPGWSEVMSWFSIAHLRGLASCIGSSGDVTLGYRTEIGPQKLGRIYSLLDTDTPITFVAINAQTGKSIARDADMRFYGASTIKAPYAAALCKYDAPGIEGQAENLRAMIGWSSNEAFDSLVASYGRFYESVFADESGFTMEYPYIGSYVDLTPRELVKLWITIREYILSSEPNSDLFRSLFTRGYFKEGWMGSGDLGGQLYHIGGVEGDTVYAIMTRYVYPDSRAWELRDALIDALS